MVVRCPVMVYTSTRDEDKMERESLGRGTSSNKERGAVGFPRSTEAHHSEKVEMSPREHISHSPRVWATIGNSTKTNQLCKCDFTS